MNKIKYFQIGGVTDVALPEDKSYVDGQVIVNPRSIKTRNFWDRITPWNTKNEDDLEALYERGFTYRGDDGKLYQVGKPYEEKGKEIGWKSFAGNIKNYNEKAERAARLRAQYGETPQEAAAPGGNVQKQMDRGANYVRITPRTYNVAISKGRMNSAYKALLQALYNNKNHGVLRDMSLDGRITDETLKTYLGNNEFNDQYLKGLGLNEQQVANIMGLIPKDPNLPTIAAGTVPETFKAADYSAFATGLDANAADYNSRLYNRVLGYRNAHNLAADAALPSDLGNLRFHNDYYVHRQGDEDFYAGPTDIYDASGKKRQKVTTIQKKGGIMKYFQAGGAVNRQQVAQEKSLQMQQIIAELLEGIAHSDPNAIKRFAYRLGIDEQTATKYAAQILKEKQKSANSKKDNDYQLVQEATQGASDMAKMAKKGSKLEYIQRLRGICPEGYEMKMFKAGGKVCKKCQKIEEACKGKKMEEGGESPIVQQFKNGRKCKK